MGQGRAGTRDRLKEAAGSEGQGRWRVGAAVTAVSCHPVSSRGAFSYLRRVVERSSGLEFAAKFIPSQAKPKASARREARLLARLQHDCVLYFHEAFERRRGLVIVTELYPGTILGGGGNDDDKDCPSSRQMGNMFCPLQSGPLS